MPTFFILSGIFFNINKMQRRLRRLLVPYICFYVASFLLYILKQLVKHETIDFMSFFIPLLGGTQGYENPPLWFLLVMAEVNILAYFAYKLIKNKYIVLSVAILLSFISSFLGKEMGPLPYYIAVAFLCHPFFLFGNIISEYLHKPLPKWLFLAALIISIGSYAIHPKGCVVSMNYIPNYFVFILTSVSTFFVIAELTRVLAQTKVNKFWSYYGKNSLIVMATHLPLVFIAPIVSSFISNMWLAVIISLIVIMGIEALVIYVVNHYFKWMLG